MRDARERVKQLRRTMVTRRRRLAGGCQRGGGDGGRDRAAAAVSTHYYTGGGAAGDVVGTTSRGRPSVMLHHHHHQWWRCSARGPTGRRRFPGDGGIGPEGRGTAFLFRGRCQLGFLDGTATVGWGRGWMVRMGMGTGEDARRVTTAIGRRLATTGSRETRHNTTTADGDGDGGRDRANRRAWLVRIRVVILSRFQILTGIGGVLWDHDYCISASGRRGGLGTLCMGCMWGSLIFCKMQQN